MVLYSALQLTVLVVRLALGSPDVSLGLIVLVTTLDLLASLGLLWLSTWTHWRSIRPSDLTVCYLLARSASYLVWTTIPGISQAGHERISTIFEGWSVFLLLLLECQDKRAILLDAYKSEPPEATTGPIGRALFLWINRILVEGYHKILQDDDIPPLDQDLSSTSLRRAILRAWDQRGSRCS